MVPYQQWRDPSRPKPSKCSGLDARSAILESTAPRALYQAGEALTPLRYARGFKHEPQPFSIRSLSLRPRNAALRLAGGRDHPNFDCGLHSNYFEPMIRPAPLA